eukprot:SM000432S16090  [mRNA]  locus=s432:21776:24695:- [translate_table: standard]
MAAGPAQPSWPGGSSGLRQPMPKVDTSRFKVTGDGVLAAAAATAAAVAAAPKQHSPIDIFKLVSPSASRRRQRSPGPHTLGSPSTPTVAVTATSRLPQEAAASPLLASQTAARSAAGSEQPTIHRDVPRHHQQGPGTGVTIAEAMQLQQSLATAARAEKLESAAGQATSKRSAGAVSERESAETDDVAAAGRRHSASSMGVSGRELGPLGAAPQDVVESPETGPQHGAKSSAGFDANSSSAMRTSRLKSSAGGHLQGLLSEEDLRDILSSGSVTPDSMPCSSNDVQIASSPSQTTACTRKQEERHLSLAAASPDLEQAQSQSPVLEKSETPTGSPSNCKRMVRRWGPAVQLESNAGVLDSEEVAGMQELDPLWEEKICAAEAAGLAGLLAKKGAVQNSPPDATKEPETPNPWSPVRKSGGLGPFDCTKRVSVEMCPSVEAT